MYKLYIIKRKIEDLFIFPFILLGRLLALAKPLQQEYEIFFFFPFFHTGGAEKVHAMVANAAGNSNSIIFFTRKSVDQRFLEDFVHSGCTIKDISRYTDNRLLYFLNLIYRGIITGYINRQKQKPIVFNGQSNFGYKISPWVKKEVPQVELIHSFNTFSWIRIPFLPLITKTIMISRVRIEDHLRQYDKFGMPDKYRTTIQHIVNGVPLPLTIAAKDYQAALKVLYVGRGTEEKRVHLVAQITKAVRDARLPVEFIFVGDVEEAIPMNLRTYCSFLGQLNNAEEISKIYDNSHVIIITSYTEGFPIVIEEAMARSCAVLATPVGDIPIHVKHSTNGFLFSTVDDEQKIIEEGIEFITLLYNDRSMLRQMGERNRQYAYNNFSMEEFNEQYRQLFDELRKPAIT